MWTEAGLSWSEFLPEDEDVNKFVTEQVCVIEFRNKQWSGAFSETFESK